MKTILYPSYRHISLKAIMLLVALLAAGNLFAQQAKPFAKQVATAAGYSTAN